MVITYENKITGKSARITCFKDSYYLAFFYPNQLKSFDGWYEKKLSNVKHDARAFTETKRGKVYKSL